MAHSVSILIIGSLFWRDSPHRKSWRTSRLVLTDKMRVRAPIRYGRLSGTQTAKSYTMVFSNELGPHHFGWALAVPCRCRVNTVPQLCAEAEALWVAEQNDAMPPGPLAAHWGAVGLLRNPRSAGLEELRHGWAQRVAVEGGIYSNFPHANGEAPAIGPDGLLTIGWPTTESGAPLATDLLLATATKPGPFRDRRYATPTEIAAAWKAHPDRREYFDKNRQNEIVTAFDDDILKVLDAR